MNRYRIAPLLILVWMSTGVSAQRGADTTDDSRRYAVAYVEIGPASRIAFAEAFNQYRERSRAEAGFGAIERFEQVGRPGHAVIVETWKDQASADAHAMGAAATMFRAALQPIRVSGYDERPYKAMIVAPVKPGIPASALHVVTHVDVSNAGGAAMLLQRLADASRREPGCLRFDVLQHTMRANHFTVIESWATPQAYDEHVAAAHTKQYREELQPLTGSPLDERTYAGIE
jgi:quinol monooxygenase YgiN